jgi:hypothetical protein
MKQNKMVFPGVEDIVKTGKCWQQRNRKGKNVGVEKKEPGLGNNVRIRTSVHAMWPVRHAESNIMNLGSVPLFLLHSLL